MNTEQILKEYNHKVELLTKFCQYFGNSKNPELCTMTEIDGQGFVLQYVENTVDGIAHREVQIRFNKPARTREQINSQISVLKREAQEAMNMVVDKSYVPPGRNTGDFELFTPPSSTEFLLVVLFWIGLYTLMGSTYLPYPLHLVVEDVIGRESLQYSVIAIFTVNLGLSCAILGFGFYTDFPMNELSQWAVLTLFFGFLTARRMIRVAYKYKAKMDKEDIIGTAR